MGSDAEVAQEAVDTSCPITPAPGWRVYFDRLGEEFVVEVDSVTLAHTTPSLIR
jgi:hypothetical protein